VWTQKQTWGVGTVLSHKQKAGEHNQKKTGETQKTNKQTNKQKGKRAKEQECRENVWLMQFTECVCSCNLICSQAATYRDKVSAQAEVRIKHK
jgi:cytochrome oxidase Cu insertion factor (SCO1/SenC/PrrC family)